MKTIQIDCDSCKETIQVGLPSEHVDTLCPFCQAKLQVQVFPALFNEIKVGRSAEKIMVEGESTCFFHTEKKAEVACVDCGRFLCAVCDIEVGRDHVCPACIKKHLSLEKDSPLAKGVVYYDSLALALSLLAIFGYMFVFITAPVVLGLCIWGWFKQRAILPRRRWRFWVAGCIALAELATFSYFILSFFLLKGEAS